MAIRARFFKFEIIIEIDNSGIERLRSASTGAGVASKMA